MPREAGRGWRRGAVAAAAVLFFACPGVGQAGLYTSASNPTDRLTAQSAWTNPAGMTGLKTHAFYLGAGGVVPVYRFDSDIAGAGGGDGGNAGAGTFLPDAYAVIPVGERLRIGLMGLSPLGGLDGLGWDFGDDWAGRYASQGLTFGSVGFGTSLGFKVTDKWSIGVGGTLQWLTIDSSTAVRNAGAPDSQVVLSDLDDWGGRLFAGTTYTLSPATTLGIVYRSQWSVDLTGERKTILRGAGGTSLISLSQPFQLGLKLPQTLEVGLQHALSKTWILGLTFSWEDWSEFSRIPVEVAVAGGGTQTVNADLNWKDTYSGGASLTHVMHGGATFLNVGLNYASSPVSDGNRIITLPVDESLTLSFGAAHSPSQAMTWSLGGALVFNGDAEVDQVGQGVRLKGSFDTNMAIILGGSAEWRF